ncbi:GAF and ANTAR domain-containing protein [Promicromonospora thailandica]|uniref:ANTAR domain-containing protein n=1 Tax=Promicromonospora thailandica TaxID=765201 RepID=A0A9X2JYT4_9MICO|nr:GAF and ANTAR domain-containing protein [Promicromonospora thailandica]MCP2265384.1 ANTAR domain-containing protein [Promicromonospora thailandica]
MTPRDPADTLATTMSVLLRDHDVTGLLYRVVRDATRLTGSDAAGLLVRGPSGGPELLSATSHAAAELELHQSQVEEGPCVDVLATGAPIEVAGADTLLERWPTVGRLAVAAGFRSVHAYPLTWRGTVLGGLNLFCRDEHLHTDEQSATARTLADMAALVLVQPEHLDETTLADRVATALAGRVIIEQAKGVLAFQDGVSTETAYTTLVERADRDGGSLSATADFIVRGAHDD